MFDPSYHAEYLRLENAASAASAAWRLAKKAAERKNAKPAAIEALATALDLMRATGKARWDFEMSATRIVDIATLPPLEYARALFR